MKKNIIYIAAVLLLGMLVWFLVIKRGDSTLKNKDTSFSVEDTASISKIFIADMRGAKVELTRMQGYWMVNNQFVVRPDFMDVLLRTIKYVSVAYPVADAAHNEVIKELSTDNKKVMIYNAAGDLLKSYFVGCPSPDNHGTYMMMEGSENPMVTVYPGFDGTLTIRYLTDPQEIRSRSIFSYGTNEMQKIKVDYTSTPDSSYEINLLGPDSFFINKPTHNINARLSDKNFNLYAYLQLFRFINAEAFENSNPEKDTILQQKPFAVITVVDRQNVTSVLPCYYKPTTERSMSQYDSKGNALLFDRDRFYITMNDGKDFLLVQQQQFGRLLQSYNFFIRGEAVAKH